MCGIVGLVDHNLSCNGLITVLNDMSASIFHRGPDSKGLWSSNDCRIGLAHQRLKVLDLSDSGHQPMISKSGRYVLSYNGEVYNYTEIRQQLTTSNLEFESDTDTEVLLYAIDTWGLKRALTMIEGMYAFSLYDNDEQKVHIIRDRFGIKPLYWYNYNNCFAFASELKAIKKLPNFNDDRNLNSILSVLDYSYIGQDATIYKIATNYSLVTC